MAAYRMLAGFFLFLIVVFSISFMAGQDFQELKPTGTDKLEDLFPTETQQAEEAMPEPEHGGFFNTLIQFYNWVIAAITLMWNLMTGLWTLLRSIILFDIPALQVHPLLQIIRFAVVTPIVTVMSYFIFRLVRSLIPTVGGGD